ncbi:MAG: peptidoglycan bridge formation glycyltransferase FemA/FemB family protein [Elusimicrobia bacterium]|nr:peptidoglycan bridge formation glycyltransferase FemA/FemB family protein [Elusimicrobiota bacterium]
MNWTEFRRDDAAWDAVLAALPDATVFQSAAWARHKADFGWRPIRLAAQDGGAAVGAVQALAKNLPGGVRLLWARGGPVGEPASWDAGLRAALGAAAGGLASYARVCSYREAGPIPAALAAGGWSRPRRPLDRGLTYLLDLGPDPERLREGLSANWRHNLKRGNARAVVVDWTDPEPAEMESVYRALESYKGLPPQHRADALGSLARRLGPALILKRAIVDGRTAALRACAVFAGRAVDLLAAATPEGRKSYASYALLWALILEARRRGARIYDLGGADPDAARGVADFKKGVGARLVETAGEWDCARPGLLRAPIGALITWSMGKSA